MIPKLADYMNITGREEPFPTSDIFSLVESVKAGDWGSFYSLSFAFSAYSSYKLGFRFFDVPQYTMFCHEFSVYFWERFHRREHEKIETKDAEKIADFLVLHVKTFFSGRWHYILTGDFQELSSAYYDKEDIAFGQALRKISGLDDKHREEEEPKERKSVHQIMLENCVYHEDSDIFHNLEMSLMLSIKNKRLVEYYIQPVEKIHLLYLLNCCKIEYNVNFSF